jgi:glycosyltransferase involved in cell wall biosynthesis
MKLVVIHKEPFIDSVPNFKSFIMYAARNNHEILLLTTKSEKFPTPSFLSENIKYIAISERTRRLQLPTFIRFNLLCIFILLSMIFRKYKLILAGHGALVIGCLISITRLKKYCSFIIEYPKLSINHDERLSFFEKLEHRGIRKSLFLITHDKLHADFIGQYLKIKDLKYITIPNGTLGEARICESRFLHERLGIPKDRRIVLHSGGFGPWFDSKSLAKKSADLPYGYSLVFHVSHNVTDDEYYNEYVRGRDVDDKSVFSMSPAATNELDKLISSATIGLAWYSTGILGYRATMLGLAAGKVGNYLKCGVPVIVPDYDSFSYISEYACGKQIADLNQLNDAIIEIDRNYHVYSENALLCYNNLWAPEKYCSSLISELERGN